VTVLVLVGLFSCPVQAVPTGVGSWTLVQTTPAENPSGLAWSTFNDTLYFGQRGTSSDGLYRVNGDNTTTQLNSFSDPWGMAADPDDGDLFIGLDFPGVLRRVTADGSTAESFLSSFDGGDADTAGVTILPDDYSGGLFPAGTGLVTDRGFGSAEELYSFDPDVSDSEIEEINTSDGSDGFYDVTSDDSRIFIVSQGNGLFEVVDDPGNGVMLGPVIPGAGNVLEDAFAGAMDPVTGNVFVALDDGDEGTTDSRIVLVDPDTGNFTEIVTGLNRPPFASLAVTPDGQTLFVGDRGDDAIYTFNVPEPATLGVLALCGLAVAMRRRSRCR
jgi:hypothetical protein